MGKRKYATPEIARRAKNARQNEWERKHRVAQHLETTRARHLMLVKLALEAGKGELLLDYEREWVND